MNERLLGVRRGKGEAYQETDFLSPAVNSPIGISKFDSEETSPNIGDFPDGEIISPYYQLQFNTHGMPLKAPHKSKIEKTGTIFSGTLNLSNTILGAGLLGLPYAISKTGLIWGYLLFLICCSLSAVGLHLTGAVARRVPDCSYYKVSTVLGWTRLRYLVDAAVAIKCFGVATSYLIVVGDLMPEAMDYLLSEDVSASTKDLLMSRQFWIIIFTVTFVCPTVTLKNLDSLKFTSFIALICIAYVIILIISYAFDPKMDPCMDHGVIKPGCRGKFEWGFPGDIQDFCGVISIFVFGFTCHQNMFSVANEIKRNTQRRLDRVMTFSLLICIGTYLVVSYSGYHTFGNEVNSDILKNMPINIWTTVMRLVFSVNLSLSFALQCHPCRNSISNIIWSKSAWDLDKKWFFLITSLIVICSVTITMFVSSLGIVLAIVGATGSTSISYILPGIFYFQIQKRGKKRWLALTLSVIGCIVVPFTLTFVFIGAAGE